MKSLDSVWENKYAASSDEDLVLRYRDGEDGIEEYILNKYKNLVKSKAKSMFIIGGETEDLIQEGMIGLFKAIRDYDSGRDASFYTFADLCISRQMYTAISNSGRKKHAPLNSYVSLSQETSNSEVSNYYEAYSAAAEYNPEERFIEKENVDEIERIIDAELSKFEKQVIELRLTGMGCSQIARVLGQGEKSTDNALTRAKNKLKVKLQEFLK